MATKRTKCDKCNKPVKWAVNAYDQYFLVDVPAMTKHECTNPMGLRLARDVVKTNSNRSALK